MLKNYDDLSPVAIDCLREIGNIGSGSAASSLSQMLGKPIEMKVPDVCVLEYQQIIDTMGGPEKVITGILVRLMGDIKGMMMFLLEDSFAVPGHSTAGCDRLTVTIVPTDGNWSECRYAIDSITQQKTEVHSHE